jgi:hypothetical protein
MLERRDGILLVCWHFTNPCELSSGGRQYDRAFDGAGARLGFLNRRLRKRRASSGTESANPHKFSACGLSPQGQHARILKTLTR